MFLEICLGLTQINNDRIAFYLRHFQAKFLVLFFNLPYIREWLDQRGSQEGAIFILFAFCEKVHDVIVKGGHDLEVSDVLNRIFTRHFLEIFQIPTDYLTSLLMTQK